MAIWTTLLALAIEITVGYPDRVFRLIGHPVSWMGALVDRLDRALNREGWTGAARRAGGVAALLILLAIAGGVGWALERGLSLLPFGLVGVALAASTLIAQRSLHRHVADVADALETQGLAAARLAVSRIVGRDPD